MTEYGQKEGIVPAGAFDFAPNGSAVWMGSQDIESEPAESGEVLGSIVLARAIAILGEVDVEHPMELVLDAPMAASEMQQPWGTCIGTRDSGARRGRLPAGPASDGAR